MTTVYSANTAGPWLADDDAVVLDGATYLGSALPYGVGMPTLDGTFPNPTAVLIAVGKQQALSASAAQVGFQATGRVE